MQWESRNRGGVREVPDGVKNATLLHPEMHPVSPSVCPSEMGPLGTRGIAF